MKKYYLIINGKKEGPFSENELLSLDINKSTLIWYNGLNDWQEIQYVSELNEHIQFIAPPIPKTLKNSIQSIQIETPIDVNILPKMKFSKDEIIQKMKKTIKKLLKETVVLLIFFISSALISSLTYYIYFEVFRPELVSEHDQSLFNSKYNIIYHTIIPYRTELNFDDLALLKFGDFKYDSELTCLDDLYDINTFRLQMLEAKTKTISWYVFIIILSILIITRYLFVFIKWLNPESSLYKSKVMIKFKNLYEKYFT